ncbi:hypothetical protein EG68_06110 [Paragonimus skrjabini miyazakii]|uniref:RNA polymerase II-associated protein 3 n=1 Tax=Paragonimus skrjabini miyazakii TaxID=59628 RepID=A0A8S9YNU2_9TREM|nr:hypothetical protein EG68_06110 [Paragonimus skrjabini miyazakii]
MNPEKFIELQQQMQENNREVADFLSDFGAWKNTVDAKNARLHNSEKSDSNLPAVRNSLLRKQRKKNEKAPLASKKAGDRIKAYDYRAWDKFDVDKALEEVDSVPNKESSASETDEELENQRRINLAKEARELGNLRFKEGDFLSAVEHYTTSVRLTPEDPVPLTNRALVNLKLEHYASAESDCSAALVLDSKCIKALFRRALARKNLNKSPEAIEDLETILKLDAENKAALKELTQLTGRNESEIKQRFAKHVCPLGSEPNRSMRSTRKFRRIPIVEVGLPVAAHRPEGISVSKPAHGVTMQMGDVPTKTPSPVNLSRVRTSLDNSTAPCTVETPARLSSPPSQQRITLTEGGPSNWFQLERELRELNGCSSSKTTLSNSAVTYLCRICPSQYQKTIGNNLETDFLVQLLCAFSRADGLLTPAEIISRLDSLSHLPRFDVAWMMADDCDRDLFRQILFTLEADPNISRDQLNFIRKQFI